MGAEDISYLSLLFLALLVIPILYMNIKFKLLVNKRIIVSILRMTIQLSLVGLYLEYIFMWNLWYVNLLYVFVMMSLAAFSIIKSVNLPYRKMIVPTFVAIMIPSLTLLFYFNIVVVRADYIFDAKYVIPIAGMILGNVLSGVIVGMNSFYKGIAAAEKTYHYRLALGATAIQARAPYFREAVFSTINPTIASMATIGLIALPGMMTGQILGGSEPFVAIKYQIAIMLIIFIVKYFTIVLALWFCSRTLFDRWDRLVIHK